MKTAKKALQAKRTSIKNIIRRDQFDLEQFAPTLRAGLKTNDNNLNIRTIVNPSVA